MTRTIIAIAVAAFAGAASAQTKWDMPTPYADGEFHIEAAGATEDGTALFAIYHRERALAPGSLR